MSDAPVVYSEGQALSGSGLLAVRGSEVDVGNDQLRFEHHLVVIRIRLSGLKLLDKICHIVRQPQEVLFVGVVTHLTGHFQLVLLIVDRAVSLDRQQVGVGDSIEEYHPPVDLKVVGILR